MIRHKEQLTDSGKDKPWTAFMARLSHIVRSCTIILVALVGCRHSGGYKPGTQQSNDTKTQINEYILISRSSSEIVALLIPSLRESLVLQLPIDESGFGPTIHALSGPDHEGRIAYIQDYFFVHNKKDRRHLLKTVNIDGTNDTEIFSRPGDAMWASRGEIGRNLSFAPSLARVAFVSHTSGKQMPKALLSEGDIEIWDILNKCRINTTTRALDEPISWFPDGKRLAYVKLTSRDELSQHHAKDVEIFANPFGEPWEMIPAIYFLDVETGQSRFAHIGSVPNISLDGKTLLAGGWSKGATFTWNRVDIETCHSEVLGWPEQRGVIALPAQNLVLYSVSSRPNVLSILQNKKMDINLLDASTNKSKSLLSRIDYPRAISFGQVLRSESSNMTSSNP